MAVKEVAQKGIKHKDFKARLLENQKVRSEYEDMLPQFELIKQMIALRNEHKISQADLAKLINTKQSAISRLESGAVSASLSTWQKIARVLGADIEVSMKPRQGAKTR